MTMLHPRSRITSSTTSAWMPVTATITTCSADCTIVPPSDSPPSNYAGRNQFATRRGLAENIRETVPVRTLSYLGISPIPKESSRSKVERSFASCIAPRVITPLLVARDPTTQTPPFGAMPDSTGKG